MPIEFLGSARVSQRAARPGVLRGLVRFSIALFCALFASACGPAWAVLLPQLGLSTTVLVARNDSALANQYRAEVVLGLSARFQPRPLRALLPSVFDISPELAALPCDEDDTTCLAEAQPVGAPTQRWLAELQ